MEHAVEFSIKAVVFGDLEHVIVGFVESMQDCVGCDKYRQLVADGRLINRGHGLGVGRRCDKTVFYKQRDCGVGECILVCI